MICIFLSRQLSANRPHLLIPTIGIFFHFTFTYQPHLSIGLVFRWDQASHHDHKKKRQDKKKNEKKKKILVKAKSIFWSLFTKSLLNSIKLKANIVKLNLDYCIAQTSTRETIADNILDIGKKELFYLTTHSTHFIYGYMASDEACQVNTL